MSPHVKTRKYVRVVKEVDSKSTGFYPRRFESCYFRIFVEECSFGTKFSFFFVHHTSFVDQPDAHFAAYVCLMVTMELKADTNRFRFYGNQTFTRLRLSSFAVICIR